MELRQLKYFVTVAKTLNFSEAARRLYITQGTLSQQIMQLEGEVGSKLFDRTSHSVILTESGEELLPLAVATLESAGVCSDRMKDLRGALAGTLKLGTTHSFCPLMTETVKAFLKQNPGVDIKIIVETAAELLEMVRNRELDLALAFKPIMQYDEIESEPLFSTSLSVIMRNGHPLAEKESISLDDIESCGVVLPGGPLQARRIFDRYLGIDTRRLNVRLEVNDPDLIMDIVQGTNLVSIMSALASYYRMGLTAVPLDRASYKMTGCVHRPKEGYRKRSSEVFLGMLRESAQMERLMKNLQL